MDATAKTALVITFVVAALLLLLFGNGMQMGTSCNGRHARALGLQLFGNGMQTGTMISGGMMRSGSVGGISWVWPATTLIVVIGAVLLSVIFGKK
jgi:hypothetical protein